jgi:hypothetical protein
MQTDANVEDARATLELLKEHRWLPPYACTAHRSHRLGAYRQFRRRRAALDRNETGTRASTFLFEHRLRANKLLIRQMLAPIRPATLLSSDFSDCCDWLFHPTELHSLPHVSKRRVSKTMFLLLLFLHVSAGEGEQLPALCVAAPIKPERGAPCSCVSLNWFDENPVATCVPGGVLTDYFGTSLYCRSPDYIVSCGLEDVCEQSTARDRSPPVAQCMSGLLTIRRSTPNWASAGVPFEIEVDERPWQPMSTSKVWVPFHARYLNNRSTDDCGSAPLSFAANRFPASDCHPLGPTSVTLVAIDRAGRESQCRASVNIVEKVPSRVNLRWHTIGEVGKAITFEQLALSTNDRCFNVSDFRPGAVITPNVLTCADLGRTIQVHVRATSPSGAVTEQFTSVFASDPAGVCGAPAAATSTCRAEPTPCRHGHFGTVMPDGVYFCFELMPILPAVSDNEPAQRPGAARQCRLVESSSPAFPRPHRDMPQFESTYAACAPVRTCRPQGNDPSALVDSAPESCAIVVDRLGRVERLNMTFRFNAGVWKLEQQACVALRVTFTPITVPGPIPYGGPAPAPASIIVVEWPSPSLLSRDSVAPTPTLTAANAVADQELDARPVPSNAPDTAWSLISLNTMLAAALVILVLLTFVLIVLVTRISRRLASMSTSPDNQGRALRRRRSSRRTEAQ